LEVLFDSFFYFRIDLALYFFNQIATFRDAAMGYLSGYFAIVILFSASVRKKAFALELTV
jgi:hypothetical protein